MSTPMTPTSDQKERCPFCGEGAALPCFSQARREAWLQCRGCGARGPMATGTVAHEIIAAARDLWDRSARALTRVPAEQRAERSSCGICGGVMVNIRGRHPKDDRRNVCPTCLADRMDTIREMADRNYGVAYTDKREPLKPIVAEEKKAE